MGKRDWKAKSCITAIFIVNFLAAGNAIADRFELKGFRLGMSRDTVMLTRTGTLACKDISDGRSRCPCRSPGIDMDTVAGEAAIRWDFGFDATQSLESVAIVLASRNSAAVLK